MSINSKIHRKCNYYEFKDICICNRSVPADEIDQPIYEAGSSCQCLHLDWQKLRLFETMMQTLTLASWLGLTSVRGSAGRCELGECFFFAVFENIY